jgi:hypothetical protein
MSLQKLNFKKLQEFEPSVYHEMINSQGHHILFVEHPFFGDEYPVIIMFTEHEKAFNSEFYDLDDMLAEHGEYEPLLITDEEEKIQCVFGYELKRY